MGRQVLLFAISCVAAIGQQSKFVPEPPQIDVREDTATWKSPEDILRDLRSEDKAVRMYALRLVGVQQISGDENPSTVDLRYMNEGHFVDARWREDTIAVISLSVASSSFDYAAVAIPTPTGWKRIAVFECWCKYDNDPGFTDLSYVPIGDKGRFVHTLKIRIIAGGTGAYEQTEAWFALRNDRLEPVISYLRQQRSCAPASPCYRARRWFDGRQMIEGRNDDVRNTPRAMNDDLEVKNFKAVICTPYKFDNAAFRYVPSGPAKPCPARTP